MRDEEADVAVLRGLRRQRLTGRGITGLARELNDRGVPCPSHVDPDRNSHGSSPAKANVPCHHSPVCLATGEIGDAAGSVSSRRTC